MKNYKKSGVVFQLTLLIMFVLLAILSLMKIKIESIFNVSKFYNQRIEDREKMNTLSSVVFYEFETLDNYILMGEINSLEEYIFLNATRQEIWNKNFESEKSLGGYYIKNSSHNFEEIYKEQNYLITFIFEKKILIKNDKDEDYLEVKLTTNEILLNCQKKEKELECDLEEDIIKKFKVEGDFIY
ncbi:MAG: hypothetical protein ACRC6A_00705 [Fusobacteriaceae bacterium]